MSMQAHTIRISRTTQKKMRMSKRLAVLSPSKSQKVHFESEKSICALAG